MTEHLLHRLHVGPIPHEEGGQRMAQVVKPEAHLLAFFKHTRLHRSRSEMILDQHIGDAGL